MSLLGIIRKSLISVLALIAGSAAGVLLFQVFSISHILEGRGASTFVRQQADAPLNPGQKELEDLLDLNGEAFIEIAQFKGSYKYGDYWQYDDEFQEIVSSLESYHRFIIRSEFKKNVVDPHGFEGIGHDMYYRLLVGPFSKEEAVGELSRLSGMGYKDAFIQQLMKSDELYPPEENRLLFLYTGNKGHKFISGWLHHWFGIIEYVVDNNSRRMLFHSIDTYHGDRYGRRLFLADGDSGIISSLSDNSQGFVLLPDSGKALVQKSFNVESSGPLDHFEGMRSSASLMHLLDRADLERVAKEIGVAPYQLQVQVIGYEPVAKVSALFELDLKTGVSKPFKLFGGFGGIFMLKDGTIYLSNNHTLSYYREMVDLEETLGLFGHRPYQLLDLKKRRLIDMPRGFQPSSGEVIQPRIARQSDDFTIIAETGVVRLISSKGGFYLQH